MDDFGFGNGGFDWNGNDKNDMFDDYMHYKVSGSDKASTGTHNHKKYSSKYDKKKMENERKTSVMAERAAAVVVGFGGTLLAFAVISAMPVLGIVFLGGIIAGVYSLLKKRS